MRVALNLLSFCCKFNLLLISLIQMINELMLFAYSN